MKLHLGCGPVIKEGFINYDKAPGEGGISLDLRDPLPHQNNSVEFIFTEHFLEHLTRDEALKLLKECHRVLIPNGKIRVTVPDLEQLAKYYLDGHITEWKDVWAPKTPCQMLNEGMKNWDHKFMYDKDELILILQEAGFSSCDHVAHGLYEARKWSGEITVEGIK